MRKRKRAVLEEEESDVDEEAFSKMKAEVDDGFDADMILPEDVTGRLLLVPFCCRCRRWVHCRGSRGEGRDETNLEELGVASHG